MTYCPVAPALITRAQQGTGGNGRKRERIDERREENKGSKREIQGKRETSEKEGKNYILEVWETS